MRRIIRKLSGLILVFVAISILAIYSYDKEEDSILTSSSTLSNAKIGWGVKREKDHRQPDLRKDKYKFNAEI